MQKIQTREQLNFAFGQPPKEKYDTVTDQTLFLVHMLFHTFAQEMWELLPDGVTKPDAITETYLARKACLDAVVYGKQVQALGLMLENTEGAKLVPEAQSKKRKSKK